MIIKKLNLLKRLRLLCLASIMVLYSFSLRAQSTTMTGTPASGVYYSNNGITLTPVFSFTASPGQSLQLSVQTDCLPLNTNVGTSQNYILTSIPRISGFTNADNLANQGTCQLMQTIQYIDGLGRPLQTIQIKGSVDGRDVVQPVAYDQFGRKAVKYLPYAAPAISSDGSFKSTAITDQAQFYATPPPGVSVNSYPSANSGFEPSPLNRVVEQGAPGAAWQLSTSGVSGSGHTVTIAYGINVANDVILWTVNSSENGATDNTYYAANTLFTTTTTDENGNSTIEYKDMQGRVICKKVQSGPGTYITTDYVYNDLENLTYVIPPIPNGKPASFLETDAVFNNFIYGYHYDNRNRLMTKKIPGKGVEEMVYNPLDQLVFNRDANKRASGQWGFTKYDGQGRVIETGITVDTSSRAPLQTYISYHLGLGEFAEWETATPGSATQGYSNNAFPFGNNVIPLTVNYYDDYTFQGQPGTVVAPVGASVMTKGLLTATKTAVLNTISTPAVSPDMLWAVDYYDDLGRTIQNYKQHYLGGTLSPYNYDVATNTYDFTNEVTAVSRSHYGTNTGNTAATLNATIANTYVYDHTGRKIQTLERINGGPTVLLSQTDYNEVAQVMTRHLHSTNSGSSFLQNIDYAYNERGWLLSNSAPLFEEQLQYNNVTSVSGITPVAQYNGNIASQSWGTSVAPNSKSYTYAYDSLNRLLGGTSTDNNNETGITYDLLGNITALNRYQANTLIDQLAYAYTNGGNYSNQLQSISDGSGNNAGLASGTMSYTYDANGNLLSNTNTAITTQNKSFTYNLLNLPIVATVATGTATYTYDAAGNKLRKVDVLNGVTKTTDYISGIEYDNSTTTIGFIQTEEGKAVPVSGGYDYTYYLGDNLGNTRVTFDTQSGAAAVQQQDDYYPFGFEINHIVTSPKNEYLYNGKELQEETGLYDYGARFYDPVIGRFTTIDPHADKHLEWSPFAYVYDDPIKHIDPDGQDGIIIAYPDYKVSTPVGKMALGHGGVLLINNKTGATKYYEYGRYDKEQKGIVRNVKVSDVVIGEDGKPTVASLNKVLKQLSKKAGEGGKIEGAYVKSDDFEGMNNYAKGKLAENDDPKRKEYSLFSNNCGTFAADVVDVDPKAKKVDSNSSKPGSIVSDYQEVFPSVSYDPKTDKTTVKEVDKKKP